MAEGHEHGHEGGGLFGKHEKWMNHAAPLIAAGWISIATMGIAPMALAAANVLLPQYLTQLGVLAGAGYLAKHYSSDKKGGGHGHDHGHH